MARVLIIAYSNYVRDGRVKRHAEALAWRGDHVDVICLAGERLRSANGVTTIGIKMPRYHGSNRIAYIRSYARFFASAAATAIRLSRAQPYDAVVACSMPDAVVLCAAPLKLFRTRVILDIHDTMPELYRDKFSDKRGALGARLLMLEERMSAWLADRVLAVHGLHRNRLVAAGIPAGKISVVLNSPDLKIFDPGAFRRTNGRAGMTLVCHGTVARRLGLDIAIKALELLGPEERAVRLMVIGRGDYLAEAKALVAAMKLEDRVSFIAPVPIEGLPALLAQADVGLVPNRPSAATHLMLPVKMLEYATLGLPILAARLQTMERYFGDGAVRFFEPGNPEALAAAIRELHRNPKRRYELAERASEVAETLSWRHQQDRYFDAIDSAAKPALSSNNESCGRDDAGSP